MANFAVSKRQNKPDRLLRGSRSGLRLARSILLVGLLALFLVPAVSWAAKLSLKLSGGITFPDQSPALVSVLGPETVTLEVTVGNNKKKKKKKKKEKAWNLTLIANSDFQSGPDVIPISVVSWTAFPSPLFQSGVLSTVVPRLIASGVGEGQEIATFDFYMQNSWSYNTGNYSSTAAFTLSSP